MNYLNKNITAEILFDHFRFFQLSLLNYSEKYQKLVFREGVTIPSHLAYICPLCLDKYIVLLGNDLNVNAEFSLDHIPPKNIGGTLELITCKKCNNDAGKYEAELGKKLEYDAFTKRQVESAIENTRLKISGVAGNYKSFIKVSEDGTPIIDFPVNAKHEMPFLNTWLESLGKTEDWTITLTVPIPNDKKKMKALLKAAYLICFFYWGYEFTYSQNGEQIRKVLNDEQEYPMNGPAFWINTKSLGSEINIPLGVGIIEKPVELQSYYVNIPVEKNDTSYIATMLIPISTNEGWKKLREIHSYLTNNTQMEVTFHPLNMSLPNIINGYTQNWSSFKQSSKS
jgi:hypothetical protein